MKKYLLAFAIFNSTLIFTLLGLYYLAAANPFQPGDILYGAQSAAENERIHLTGDPLLRAELHLDLVKRRLANIAMAADDRQLNLALIAYDQCLSEAIGSIQSLTPAQARELSVQIDQVLVQASAVLAGLGYQPNSAALALAEEKALALQPASRNPGMPKTVQDKSHFPGEIIARLVPFFGIDVDHGAFPMTGGHEAADCLECHSDGTYENTPTDCATCHTLERELDWVTSRLYDQYLPLEEHNARHYSDACADCHSVDDWTTIQYDHQQAQRCNACHIADIPQAEIVHSLPKVIWNIAWKTNNVRQDPTVKHYPGDCSVCHQDTKSWETYIFDHKDTCKTCHSESFYEGQDRSDPGAFPCSQNCESCHAVGNHEEDYPGNCTNCHNDVEDWSKVTVDHGTYSLCYQCHTDDRPADHYSGSCILCHSTTTWQWGRIDHDAGSNCRACHQRPEGHSTEQCGTCHTTKGWLDNIKKHDSDKCSDCHAAPNNHYTSNCVDCHSTSAWREVTFTHDQASECGACHAAPQVHYTNTCSDCHSTVNWFVGSDVLHTLFNNCLACHAAPLGHWQSQCSDCHTTQRWEADTNLLHTNFSDCTGCHFTPAQHWPGACTVCHLTMGWGVDNDQIHAAYSNCAGCHGTPTGHWQGECSICHTTADWGVDHNQLHAAYYECVSCHITPNGHWPGECANCHNTSSWTEVAFDHTGYTDCKACHPRPSGHQRGQCSKCHSTDTWTLEDEATETATSIPAFTPTDTPGPVETAVTTNRTVPSGTPTP